MSQAAPPAAKGKAMPDAEVVRALGPRSVVLVGMMGAGKSSIGRRLATIGHRGGGAVGFLHDHQFRMLQRFLHQLLVRQ